MIFEKVKEKIAEQLGVDEDDITLESTFDDLGADSFDVVELVIAVEEEFDIEIPDDKVADFETVEEVVEYIKANK